MPHKPLRRRFRYRIFYYFLVKEEKETRGCGRPAGFSDAPKSKG
jgi:hypothetical protein